MEAVLHASECKNRHCCSWEGTATEWWRLEHMASHQLDAMHHVWPSTRMRDCCRREDETTRVVAPSLKRVAKVLAALAAGTWILSTEFLDASHAARTLVEPVCHMPM